MELSDSVALSCGSIWRSETPYVFLNTMKPSEHSWHDAAHELGHLVMHKHGGPRGRAAEEQANHFAAALLMPAAAGHARAKLECAVDEIRKAENSLSGI
jgi:Zn-dependent peptidase ImmA (M78 family)